LSFVVCIVSGWSAWQEALARGQLKDSDITLQLTAWKVDAPSASDLEYHTPPSIEIGLVIPSEADWRCFLEPLPGFIYSGPSRGASVRQRVYITKATNSQGTHPKYVLLRIASRPGHVPAKVIQPRDASLQASGGSRRLLLALSCVAQDGASSVVVGKGWATRPISHTVVRNQKPR
jgi:hypothetical protein